MSDKNKRGGARPGAGRKKQLPEALAGVKLDGRTAAGKSCAGRVLAKSNAEQVWLSIVAIELERLGIDTKTGKRLEGFKVSSAGAISKGEFQGTFSVLPLFNILKYLDDRHFGRPVDTVNHLHDKPIELNATLSLGEGMRLAMEKAEQRVSKRGN